MMHVDFSRVPMGSRKKVTRLFELIKFLPTDFISNEVISKIRKEMKIGDVQRSLFQLVQGGLLDRSHDRWGRIVYNKTEVARGSDGEVARQIIDNAHLMYGYESPEERKQRRGTEKKVIQRIRMEARTPGDDRIAGKLPPFKEDVPAPQSASQEKVVPTHNGHSSQDAPQAPNALLESAPREAATQGMPNAVGNVPDAPQVPNVMTDRPDIMTDRPDVMTDKKEWAKWTQLMLSYRKVQDVFPGMTVEEFLEMYVERRKVLT